ncbi:hypothetical protein [Pseudoalteromonas luteoviolacea]|uniref:Uncharacterized protein n=1 Tax=Pseudoalteromonas luteoviolacea S4060-1 TaxID=1365257 RepID=A0A167LQP9_9GAMM|nr:hypothetical protein [Pseudoalteromonas luteoviolacea]KZN65025.1 hypothetical protein N478_03185 [Pseudoalteromonas luteoviolacea S4060-1]
MVVSTLFQELLYVTKDSNYERLKALLAHAFSIKFSDRQSGWWGEYALWQGSYELSIKLFPNFVAGEGFHEEKKREYPYLREITGKGDLCDVHERILSLPTEF